MTKNIQPKLRKRHIAVALSGGVDSSMAAFLLKQAGHQVTAIFMNNWEVDSDNPSCTASQDIRDAQAVADYLGIPLQIANFKHQYWDQVFQYCLDEFVAGRTPNPDIWCNKYIKFKALMDYALNLGAEYLATGHYARITGSSNQWELIKGVDCNKDQTYFLHLLNQAQLSKTLFPIGEYHKNQVRAIAKEVGLLTHEKKDSTGICFIGKRKFRAFLKEFLLTQPGHIQTTDGETIGKHEGLMFYTIGQRKGLYIGGQQGRASSPWYVLAKKIASNILIVGQGHDHPDLYTHALTCTQVSA